MDAGAFSSSCWKLKLCALAFQQCELSLKCCKFNFLCLQFFCGFFIIVGLRAKLLDLGFELFDFVFLVLYISAFA